MAVARFQREKEQGPSFVIYSSFSYRLFVASAPSSHGLFFVYSYLFTTYSHLCTDSSQPFAASSQPIHCPFITHHDHPHHSTHYPPTHILIKILIISSHPRHILVTSSSHPHRLLIASSIPSNKPLHNHYLPLHSTSSSLICTNRFVLYAYLILYAYLSGNLSAHALWHHRTWTYISLLRAPASVPPFTPSSLLTGTLFGAENEWCPVCLCASALTVLC
jgi:hypothetical protein